MTSRAHPIPSLGRIGIGIADRLSLLNETIVDQKEKNLIYEVIAPPSPGVAEEGRPPEGRAIASVGKAIAFR